MCKWLFAVISPKHRIFTIYIIIVLKWHIFEIYGRYCAIGYIFKYTSAYCYIGLVQIFEIIMSADPSAYIFKITAFDGYIFIHRIIVGCETAKMRAIENIYLYRLRRADIEIADLAAKLTVWKYHISAPRKLCVVGIIIIGKFHIFNQNIFCMAKAEYTGFIRIVISIESAVFDNAPCERRIFRRFFIIGRFKDISPFWIGIFKAGISEVNGGIACKADSFINIVITLCYTDKQQIFRRGIFSREIKCSFKRFGYIRTAVIYGKDFSVLFFNGDAAFWKSCAKKRKKAEEIK